MMIDSTEIERYREIGSRKPSALSLIFEMASEKNKQ